MNHTLHSIKRIKNLTHDWAEVLFVKNKLMFTPGDEVVISFPSGEKRYFIASGMQEVWIRILVPQEDLALFNSKSVRVSAVSKHLTLIKPNNVLSNSIYIVDDSGIAPVLSLCSTLPKEKLLGIYYETPEAINREWLLKYQNTKLNAPIKDIPIGKYDYYVIMKETLRVALTVKYLLDRGIPSTCIEF